MREHVKLESGDPFVTLYPSMISCEGYYKHEHDRSQRVDRRWRQSAPFATLYLQHELRIDVGACNGSKARQATPWAIVSITNHWKA